MLPQPGTEAERDALDRRGAAFIQAVREAFVDRVGTMPIKATSAGSYPVFYVGDQYVAKLYSTLDRDKFQTEAATLQLLDGYGDIPTPTFVEAKEVASPG